MAAGWGVLNADAEMGLGAVAALALLAHLLRLHTAMQSTHRCRKVIKKL